MNEFQLRFPGRTQSLELSEHTPLGREAQWPGATEPKASDRHARIERKEQGYLIRDLRSEHGTFVNGTRVSEAWLQPGDEIRIGDAIGLFQAITVEPVFGLTSKCPAWKEQLKRVASVAQSPFPVLLLGPSGTGKEVLAESIHNYSSRRDGPFVRVNCSALTETLVESELFGHVKGSFTGAIADRKGAFESARGGTLFLDEIGDLPYGLQAKLLRALENNEIRSVGSDRTIQTDVRILAATHQNLIEKIHAGSFRTDLYYRLNVVAIQPPALNERMDDFEDLLYGFAKQMRVRFSHGAIQKLKKHTWPGNIRELKNTVARASAFFPQRQVEETDVVEILDRASVGTPLPSFPGAALAPAPVSVDLPVIKEMERQMIVKRLIANHGNQRRTAQDLGMPKSTLHDRLKLYNIDPRQYAPGYPGLEGAIREAMAIPEAQGASGV